MLQRLRCELQIGKEAKIEINFLMVKWTVIQATNTRNIEIVMLCGQAQAVCLSVARAARRDFQNTVLNRHAGVLEIAGNTAKRVPVAHAFRHRAHHRTTPALRRNNARID
ncbi:hypothetical protein NGUA15_00412 [Salmonella enterica]|nr:hypothetical protein NGUA15_00412 [Salmonella enterica]